METLLLDVGMQPVDRVPWMDAVIKTIIKKTARVIEEYPDRYINTVNWTVNMPSVIMLLKPTKRSKAVRFSRHGIYQRDRGRCQYCGEKVRRNQMQYEHVIPRAQGGTTCWTNIVAACNACNSKKGARTPAQAGMKLLSKPVRPKSLSPDGDDHGITYNPGMPNSWRNYLRDSAYWNAPLEEG